MSLPGTPPPMSQSPVNVVRKSPGPLPGVPRPQLTATEQLEALRRVRAQAEQRVQLGHQLFNAAKAQTARYEALLAQIKAEQVDLRERVTRDVAQTLHSYDQWVGKMDQSITDSIDTLHEKMEAFARRASEAEQRILSIVERAEALLDQSRYLQDTPPPAPSAEPGTGRAMAQPSSAGSPAPGTQGKGEANVSYSDLLRGLRDKGTKGPRGG